MDMENIHSRFNLLAKCYQHIGIDYCEIGDLQLGATFTQRAIDVWLRYNRDDPSFFEFLTQIYTDICGWYNGFTVIACNGILLFGLNMCSGSAGLETSASVNFGQLASLYMAILEGVNVNIGFTLPFLLQIFDIIQISLEAGAFTQNEQGIALAPFPKSDLAEE